MCLLPYFLYFIFLPFSNSCPPLPSILNITYPSIPAITTHKSKDSDSPRNVPLAPLLHHIKNVLSSFLNNLRAKRISSLHEYLSTAAELSSGVPYQHDLPFYNTPPDRSKSTAAAAAGLVRDSSLKVNAIQSQNSDPRSSPVPVPAPVPYTLSQPPFQLPHNAVFDNLSLSSADQNAER